jgi:hypothetical protein
MNYKHIYREFIRDRRQKELVLIGYSERHHILPRSLRGSNKRSNIIRLTPEDHFFAHLLLAKIHGRHMWRTLAFMIGKEKYQPIISRGYYGWAARRAAEAKSGKNAPQYDHEVYNLENRDGRKWFGTQAEMSDQLQMTRSLANMLVKRKIVTALDWYLAGTIPLDQNGSNHPGYRHEKYTFRHIDGRCFVGTQFELRKKHAVSPSGASELVNGRRLITNGWSVKDIELPKRGRWSSWKLETNNDQKICEHCHNSFARKIGRSKWKNQRFCSKKCSSSATIRENAKKANSKAHKNILRNRWLGNSLTKGKPWSAARRLAWLSSKNSEETRIGPG